jgi:hypothetical protein
MQRIVQANIDRFNLLLETETDQVKRRMIVRLLAEETQKLTELTRPEAREMQ